MALLAALTTWSAGDKLTATSLNDEFLNILDAINGSDQDNLKTVYNAADLPTYQLVNSHASGYALQAGDGTNNDLFGVKSTGVIESKVTTGTAPLIVASTTMIDNLNADQVDGIEAANLIKDNVATQDITSPVGNITFGVWGDAAPGSDASLTVGPGLTSGDYAYFKYDATNTTFQVGHYDSGATYTEQNLTFDYYWTGSGAGWIYTFEADAAMELRMNLTGSTDNWGLKSTGANLSLVHNAGAGDQTVLSVVEDAAGEYTLSVPADATLDIQGNNKSTIQTLTHGGTITWDCDQGSSATLQLALLAGTLANLTNPEVGAHYTLIVKQDGTGGRTLGFGSYYKFSGGVPPTITTTANAVDVLSIFVESATIFHVTAVQNML
jgi:hypothetical protein